LVIWRGAFEIEGEENLGEGKWLENSSWQTNWLVLLGFWAWGPGNLIS